MGKIVKDYNNHLHFISKDEFYFKEKSGIKTNTVRTIERMQPWKRARITRMLGSRLLGTITIQRGYTAEKFTRQLTDISQNDGIYIFSWVHSDKDVELI